MTEPAILFRPLTPDDEPIVWDAVYHAIFVPEGQSSPPRTIVSDPNIARYAAGWGRWGDLGFVAETAPGKTVGVCWLRVWSSGQRGYGYVDDATPELSLAVWPGRRGGGIGTRLLSSALTAAAHEFADVSLSVSATNPAVRLYERSGFRPVDRQGTSIVMLWSRPAF